MGLCLEFAIAHVCVSHATERPDPEAATTQSAARCVWLLAASASQSLSKTDCSEQLDRPISPQLRMIRNGVRCTPS